MEEKILNILLNIQKDVSVLKGDVNGLKDDVKNIKEDQRIMKLNIARILERQEEINEHLKKHEKEANIRYEELDHRLSLLEA